MYGFVVTTTALVIMCDFVSYAALGELYEEMSETQRKIYSADW